MTLACKPAVEADHYFGLVRWLHGALGDLHVPATVIAGADSDTPMPGQAVPFFKELAGHLGGLEAFEAVPGGTHFLPMEAPALVADRVTAAIEACLRGGGDRSESVGKTRLKSRL